MQKSELTQFIKAEAKSLGFLVCGIAKADSVNEPTSAYLAQWVGEGRNGTMGYLQRNSDKRTDPRLLVPGCRSIVCVALNYCPRPQDIVKGRLHLSRYALGKDYHKVVKDRLFMLLKRINELHPVQGRAFCDTAPLLERYWAAQSGIGFIGKNHQLIIPEAGSYFFLGELLIDAELDYDVPMLQNPCGDCDRCIKACPSGALKADGFDARQCLSYLTIEHRDELPKNIGKMMGNCFYGCDRCQTSCPYNRDARSTDVSDFWAAEALLAMSDDDWHNLSPEKYNELFADSAVERCGYEQLVRNISACKK